MQNLSEDDFRQLRRMRDIIYSFEKKSISLQDLVDQLTGLLDFLESLDNSSRKLLKKEMNELEQIVEACKEGTISLWTENPQEIVTCSIDILKKTIEAVLKNCLNSPHPVSTDSAIILDEQWLLCPKCVDGWECVEQTVMVFCPKCGTVLHNPRRAIPEK